ncbi:MAG: AAA family ATPase [Coriobacteriia bacterium]|nr:AAA family ATPase [Coriobacteriia bacterium]
MSKIMLDVLTVVSSDKHFPLEVAGLMTNGAVRLVHTFRSGAECFRALALDDPTTQRIVIIDKLISDISPLNLCDAIRLSHPNLGIIVVTEVNDVDYVQRAMLAGARATISRQASVTELELLLERLTESASAVSAGNGAVQISPSSDKDVHRAVVVPLIGARGGAGRSTISCALAYLAAQMNINTAVLDLDLQFGDLGFLFGSTGKQRIHETFADESCDLSELFEALTVSNGAEQNAHRRFGRQLASNLSLYAPRAIPEKAEALAQVLPAALERLRHDYELIVVNTGAYWTLFHGELLEHSDIAICVFDQSVVGVRATAKLKDLCRRLGIPVSRLLFVMNRMQQSGLRAQEVAEVLLVDKVMCIHDSGRELAVSLDSGQIDKAFQNSTLTAEIMGILDELAVRSDLVLHDTAAVRHAMRREGGTRLLSAKRTIASGETGNRRLTRKEKGQRGLLRRAPEYRTA